MSLPEDETQETTTPQPEWPAHDLAGAPETDEPMPPEFEAPEVPDVEAVADNAPVGEPEMAPEVAAESEVTAAPDSMPQPGLPPMPEPSAAEPLGEAATAATAVPPAAESTLYAASDAAADAPPVPEAPGYDSPTTQTQVPPVVAVPAAGAAAQQAQPWQAQQPQTGQWQQPQVQPPQAQQPQPQWPQSQQAQWQQPQPQQQWQQQQPQQWQQPGQYPQQQYGQQYGQQQYQQPYPQGYQQYPQQGYQQPYYPAQQGPIYSTSALVAIAAILLAVFGIVDLLGGVWLLTQGEELRSFIGRTTINLFGTLIDRETMRALLAPSPGVLMVFGLVELLAAIGILAHKGWARAIGIILALLGLLVMIGGISFAVALSSGFSVPLIGTIAALIGYAFILVALFAGGSHFRRRTAQR